MQTTSKERESVRPEDVLPYLIGIRRGRCGLLPHLIGIRKSKCGLLPHLIGIGRGKCGLFLGE
jgi:hypothetical protein